MNNKRSKEFMIKFFSPSEPLLTKKAEEDVFSDEILDKMLSSLGENE